MPRAEGNDFCELFGFAPDDLSETARKQWKSQQCPFVGGVCVKHSHPQRNGQTVVYGSCSVRNQTRERSEEVIVCPQRLYAGSYEALRRCVRDAIDFSEPIYLAGEYSALKREGKLPREYAVCLGHKSGREISLSNPGVIELSIDWAVAVVLREQLNSIIPCEVQSIDTTGNYHDTWEAYSRELPDIPNSRHGMNWANVWKRLIPQLILKGCVASTSTLCKRGLYFIVPDRVYVQFEKLVGEVAACSKPGPGVLTVMTYGLGPAVPPGQVRELAHLRTMRMSLANFAVAFSSGRQLPLGTQLDAKVAAILAAL